MYTLGAVQDAPAFGENGAGARGAEVKIKER
jgi:hypothetical protein